VSSQLVTDSTNVTETKTLVWPHLEGDDMNSFDLYAPHEIACEHPKRRAVYKDPQWVKATHLKFFITFSSLVFHYLFILVRGILLAVTKPNTTSVHK